jgi:hypothetical protein
MGIGCVGTARFQYEWPPTEFRAVTEKRFNCLHLQKDIGKFLICRWVDNNVVTLVTNVHTGREKILRARRRPRLTAVNRRNVQAVWGNDPVKEIEIPAVIDDYNHWMGGVDLADQMIAYYRPNVRCRRTWMPLLFHALDVARVNSYIALVNLGWNLDKQNKNTPLHKEFILELIKALMARAFTAESRLTRHRAALARTPSPQQRAKRRRTSTKNPSLPEHRLLGDRCDHIRTDAPSQGICRMCSYLHYKAKSDGTSPLPPLKRPKKWCHFCKDHLCTEHFDSYHRRT